MSTGGIKVGCDWILACSNEELCAIHAYGLKHARLQHKAIVISRCSKNKTLLLSTVPTDQGTKYLTDLGIGRVAAGTVTRDFHNKRVFSSIVRVSMTVDVPLLLVIAVKSGNTNKLNLTPTHAQLRFAWKTYLNALLAFTLKP